MKPETRQEVIDQVKRIAEKGCNEIECEDCIFENFTFEYYDAQIIAAAFLIGAELKEDNFTEDVKCYECKHSKDIKTQLPCSACSRRPHDLCCENHFDPLVEKIQTVPIM